MKHRVHDPLRLDVAAFAADGGELAGSSASIELPRLAESQSPPQDMPAAQTQWQARGERRVMPLGDPELWLHLSAQTSAWLSCQRCLQPYRHALAIDRRLRFVRDEAQAEALDAETEDDVLALPRWLDLRQLIEDELLLALPLVPLHARCPQPLPVAAEPESDGADKARPNPFAILESLKARPGGPGAQ